MNIFGVGLPEMILIMLVALLVFGPKKLPEIGRSMGKAIKGFQDASREFESEFKREADRMEQVTLQVDPPTPNVAPAPIKTGAATLDSPAEVAIAEVKAVTTADA
ncbi:MAG: Sec-independent protein translocase TatA [Oscillatoriales cyanobacterium CG2_30_44_21]|nr:MAG: Sec-independent protein translocase TatA [Oscillatoriales cyanobacterium CG2_30_44_21]